MLVPMFAILLRYLIMFKYVVFFKHTLPSVLLSNVLFLIASNPSSWRIFRLKTSLINCKDKKIIWQAKRFLTHSLIAQSFRASKFSGGGLKSHLGQLFVATSKNPLLMNTICSSSFHYNHVISSTKLWLKFWRKQ